MRAPPIRLDAAPVPRRALANDNQAFTVWCPECPVLLYFDRRKIEEFRRADGVVPRSRMLTQRPDLESPELREGAREDYRGRILTTVAVYLSVERLLTMDGRFTRVPETAREYLTFACRQAAQPGENHAHWNMAYTTAESGVEHWPTFRYLLPREGRRPWLISCGGFSLAEPRSPSDPVTGVSGYLLCDALLHAHLILDD